MRVLNGSEIRQALPMDQAIEAMKSAFATLSAGRAEVPLRAALQVPPQEAVSLLMPAFIDNEDEQALAVKIVSVFPHNVARGVPLINAAVLVLDPQTGRLLALLEGGVLTAIRTGAASGAATDLLARADSRTAALFGAGPQGHTQLEAVCTVRSIQKAWIYDPTLERAESFVDQMAGLGPVPNDLRVAESPAQALADADIVCTATTSNTPVFDDHLLKPGAHINGVGSYTPEMQEVPAETVARALVIVDSREAALAEAGDLIQPVRQGFIEESHIHSELGEIVLGRVTGRSNREQVTFFKSVGNAVQDVAAAQLALKNAEELKLGQIVDW